MSPYLMNKVSNNETNEQIHSRNARTRQNSNLEAKTKCQYTIATELKRILHNAVRGYILFFTLYQTTKP